MVYRSFGVEWGGERVVGALHHIVKEGVKIKAPPLVVAYRPRPFPSLKKGGEHKIAPHPVPAEDPIPKGDGDFSVVGAEL